MLPENARELLPREIGPGPLELLRAVSRETLAVSCTGNRCALSCAHCSARYLKGMKSLDSMGTVAPGAFRSVLVSGGCDFEGRVPIGEHVSRLLELPPDLPMNLHVGFQDSARLLPLAGRDVTVSYDLIGDSETVREVMGIDVSFETIRKNYLDLAKHFRVIPHLTIGLRGGKTSGEDRVLDFLFENPPEMLTFLVFRPTPKTPFEKRSPPPLVEVVRLIGRAAGCFPGRLSLGCMRPSGEYRGFLDALAWAAGARSIVLPDRNLVRTLRDHGIPVREITECCAFHRSGSVRGPGGDIRG